MALRRILVPFDGSAFARSALELAAWLAAHASAQVTVLYAVEGEIVASGRDNEDSVTAARQWLSAQVDGLKQALRLDAVAVPGEPVRAIMEQIAREDQNLVVMGTFGRRAVSQWVLGSVADKVARSAPVPIILVPNANAYLPGSGQPLRVLAALDESKMAETVLDNLRDLAPAVPLQVTLFEVIDREMPGPVARKHIWRRLPVGGTGKYLLAMQERQRAAGLTCQAALAVGEPAGEIVDLAREDGSHLIAITPHGKGGRPQILMGNVAEQVVRKSGVPVLIGHARSGAEHGLTRPVALNIA